jgi:hypothetical protein
MNNHTIDGNKISFKGFGRSIKLIVVCPHTDDLKITVNDTELSCNIQKQDNPHAIKDYIVTRKFYIEANDNDPLVDIVNDWLIKHSLTSHLVSSEYKWHQNFGGKVAPVATKYEDGIPKLTITPIIRTPIAPNTVLTVLTTLTEQVKDLNEKIENDKRENAYYGRPIGIGRGPTRGVGGITRGVGGITRGVGGINRGVNRGPTRGSGTMQAVFKKSETNNQPINTRSHTPIDIIHIQDIDNFLTCNNTCHSEWTWYHIMNTINVTTYELLKQSHSVIVQLIDINMKFKTIMNFKIHITNVIDSLISIFENLKTTRSEYDDTVVRYDSADIITTYSSIIDTIISDVKQLKLNITQYQDEFKVLSDNEHIKAASPEMYLYDLFTKEQTNHTELITIFESFDKEIIKYPMKEDIAQLFTPNTTMSL